MDMEKKDFDREANSWDDKPDRVRLATEVTEAIRAAVPLTREMEVLDFGCGTGLVSLGLHPYVRSVTGVDSSRGMLDVMEEKIERQRLANIRTLQLDLDKGDTLTGRYDLIVTSMTLHHVPDVESLFALFHRLASPGGYLAVADLDFEGGKFHADNTGVFHYGFQRESLRGMLSDAGFEDIRDRTAAEITKPDSDGVMRGFSVFLITGRKR